MLQVLEAGNGSITSFIELLSTGEHSVSSVPAVSGSTPFLIVSPSSDRGIISSNTSTRRLQQLLEAHRPIALPLELWSTHFGDVNLSSQFGMMGKIQPSKIHSDRPNKPTEVQSSKHGYVGRLLTQEPQQAEKLVNFDVDGDGVFSAADYVALMHLGLRWTNSYAADAQPWLETFKNVTGRSEITDLQLQSTDPDFLYASPMTKFLFQPMAISAPNMSVPNTNCLCLGQVGNGGNESGTN